MAVLGHACAGGDDRPLALGAGYETWYLPAHERLGMAHAEVLFEAVPDWWLGPSVYGAASGQRGGFYVGGLAVQRPWAIGPRLVLVPALTVGGGGGGGATVGDGLMLRSSLSLQVPIGPWRAGIGVSHVRFPGTEIRSTQWGIVAEWQGAFVTEPMESIGRPMVAQRRSGLGFDRIALTGARYVLRGTSPASRVDLVGVRFDRCVDQRSPCGGVEAAAAGRSANAGYMEILGHAGVEMQLAGPVHIGARAALGFGGGGAVPTGGGTLGHLDVSLRLDVADGWRLGASLGRVIGRSASLRGTRAELALEIDLEPRAMPGTATRTGTVRRVDWAGALQWTGAVRRNDGSERALQTIGLQLNWWLGDSAYLTAQANSAHGGGAGAYGQGLLGAGIATSPRGHPLQFGAEFLAGGGGGGGVQNLSGAIAQAALWVGIRWRGDGGYLRAALGTTTRLNGSSSPMVSAGWVVPFAQVAR